MWEKVVALVADAFECMAIPVLSFQEVAASLSVLKDISIILGVLATIIAYFNYKSAAVNNKSNLFLLLRKYYYDVHDQLYKALPDLDQSNKSLAEKDLGNLSSGASSALEGYWITSFNEWFTTNVIFHNDSTGLWRVYYREAIASSLTNVYLRSKLHSMIKSNYSFGSCEPLFVKEIIEIIDGLLNNRFYGFDIASGETKDDLKALRDSLIVVIGKDSGSRVRRMFSRA